MCKAEAETASNKNGDHNRRQTGSQGRCQICFCISTLRRVWEISPDALALANILFNCWKTWRLSLSRQHSFRIHKILLCQVPPEKNSLTEVIITPIHLTQCQGFPLSQIFHSPIHWLAQSRHRQLGKRAYCWAWDSPDDKTRFSAFNFPS